ncbi:MAG: hypothetical protein K2R98_13175 [Gemmataceae bacterium]|nr:hypothetical protein [Gemmataceae bacterium]
MAPNELPDRISQISTRWSLIFEAHQGDTASATRAQLALMERYCGAIYRYLMGALHDRNLVEELCQEFAFRFVRGDYKNVQPGRGRFRDFVKTVLFHLVTDYHRQRRGQAKLVPFDSAILAAIESDAPSASEEFVNRWREELLTCAWEKLADLQAQSDQPFFEVLQFRVENPKARSGEIAETLGARLGRTLTAVGVRQTLHRAREKFVQLLYDETARSLQTDDPERVQEELRDLGLLQYCRHALPADSPDGI